MTDLAAWLTQIWDEEERLAIKAGGDHWVLDGSIVHKSRPHEDVVDWVYDEADEHIVYHDPASVLARIAADRKILEWHGNVGGYCDECGSGVEDRGPGERGDFNPVEWPCPTLRLMASPYKDRPGFNLD